MTDQLEGAELCLAVAKVMGKDNPTIEPIGRCLIYEVYDDGDQVRLPKIWDPINNPAQAWEVFLWFIENGKGQEAHDEFMNLWWLKREAVLPALLRAVAEMGR